MAQLEQAEEERALRQEGCFQVAPLYRKFERTPEAWSALSEEEQKSLLQKFRCSSLLTEQQQSQQEMPFQPRTQRSGEKRNTRLGRPAAGQGVPCPSSSMAPQPTPAAAATVDGGNSTVSCRPRYWENNYEFLLMFASNKSGTCAGCNSAILHVCCIPGERLVLKHSERFMYPVGPKNDKWSKMELSRQQTRSVYYHARSECIFPRFRPEYFKAMPIRKIAGVEKELATYPLDFQHKDL